VSPGAVATGSECPGEGVEGVGLDGRGLEGSVGGVQWGHGVGQGGSGRGVIKGSGSSFQEEDGGKGGGGSGMDPDHADQGKSCFFFSLYFRTDRILAAGLGEVSEDTRALAGAMERERAHSKYWNFHWKLSCTKTTSDTGNNQRGSHLQPVPASRALLPVAARGGAPEDMQPLCSMEITMHYSRGVGVQPETAGTVGGQGVEAMEEESGGGRGGCGVGWERGWWVEGMGTPRYFFHPGQEEGNLQERN